ncbi:unnamed protein product [Polarella glacialis]|uniref:Kinesin-like protein n=2 Tax=Polarella glacialis TaxID=89957 RepID=A0A813FGM8_POLGL|nr:unnamed protein product [Polarella glacialis]
MVPSATLGPEILGRREASPRGALPQSPSRQRRGSQPQQCASPGGKENDFGLGGNSPGGGCQKGAALGVGCKELDAEQGDSKLDLNLRPSPRTASLGDRVRAEAARAAAIATEVSSATDSSALLPPELEPLKQKIRSMSAALRRSNAQHAELQALLSRSLDRCEALKVEEAEGRRAKEHHHHRWCVLDQEREGLQRVAQQAQVAERAAKAGERSGLDEAAAWRRWLASFLDVLLRRGASGLDGDVSSSQSLQDRQPRLHALLQKLLSQATEKPTLQPEMLSELPQLYDHVAELIADGRLDVRWDADANTSERQKARADSDERGAQLERKLAQKEIAFVALEHEKRALRGEVRALQNLVQELRGSIRVFCRLRPAKNGQALPDAADSIGARAESSQRVALRKPPGDRRHDFTFDRVFSQQAGQRDLYEEVEPLLPGILEGIHVCIFAYGQTGAGKTYTLAGNRSTGEPGIQDLAIGDLLRLAESREEGGGAKYEVRLTALEIYNETIVDLLLDMHPGPAADSEKLEVRQSRENLDRGVEAPESSAGGAVGSSNHPSAFGSMRVPGLRSWLVRGPEDVDHALRMIGANRHVSATALNERSSRSHCVMSLSVMQKQAGAGDSAPLGTGGACGVLHIVDLAGSERTKISQAEGMQMKEANCINRSLSSLADVLYALGDPNGGVHIPYRNSKLTYLLQDALGGPGCKTFLFAQVSPEAVDSNESYSTLTFASRVASSVQKGKLRPPLPGAPRGSPQARGSPNIGPSRDASPRSQASECGDGSLLSSPAPASRGRYTTAPPLPGSARRSGAVAAAKDSTPERRPRSRG